MSNTLGFDFPEDFLEKFLSTTADDYCEKALTETVPILEASTVKAIKGAVKDGTGELAASIKSSKPKKGKNGAWIVNVNPKGISKNQYYDSATHRRKYPVTNALKAVWLEYGNAHQAPSPWLAKSVNSCKAQIEDRLQEIYTEMVEEK